MDKKYLVQNRYYPTIGIECHVQLKTKTKLFAGVDNDAREASPNTLISPLCIGMPGTLPVLNAAVIPLSIRAGLALRATISPTSHFDRKHYFYPDLPKGYQITQYERPIVVDGTVEAPMLDGSYVTVGIERAHLEEDAGK
nr:Asp-tRNA(Asn)/Glu-tRNA(Gln) amidotransferase subunit GatB [Candidatus Saccharibacteria bacterium]